MQTSDTPGKLARRRVIVTGAASGIGRAIAELFAAEGARLALVDRDADGLSAVAAPLGAVPIVVDLADRGGADGLVARAVAALGGLDCVVNCAAYAPAGPIEDVDDAAFERFVAVNLVAPYMICRAALPHLREAAGSSIVNIVSGQALLPNSPNNTAYAATKGGLVTFSKALAAEAAPKVRVNAVAPGITDTPMSAHLFAGYADPSDAPWVKQYALQRIAEPIEIARAVLFLASDDASYITGTVLAVDGGRTFH